ncbi:hypothetical protein [Burkholderia lata]|uniref:Uncharacterized protein n=1 Tax=Burkholderia lata (strain ATCC 17760 / DSM 23089 / LMG 22485 / NCIMB 9086 / R18194 / 383) TaxID=482957 RepID=Q398G3_BURL3|nr:hypothetical protein [Burkholderia lata]ABB11148.1 hypothetical protein Bcep18194_B1034 [Burkholderia lata]
MRVWKNMVGIVIGLLVAVVGIAWVASGNGGKDAYNPANMAYWIQAIGSIATIGGAYLLGQRDEKFQRELAEKLRTDQLQNRRSTLKALVDDAYAQVKKLQFSTSEDRDFSPVAFISVSEKSMRDSIDQIRTLPVFDLESGELVAAVLGIRRQCESLVDFMVYYNENRFKPHEYYGGDHSLKVTMNDRFEKLDKHYQDFLKIVGGDSVEIEPPQFF